MLSRLEQNFLSISDSNLNKFGWALMNELSRIELIEPTFFEESERWVFYWPMSESTLVNVSGFPIGYVF
ncbi:hypothetical protein SAMN04515695_4658 [Pseudovibrio sp. Tun.PSC04-5.I4]|nr:hypothetical protein SAMN04515695_4658 [Pseudovibrio sp. Tun.PSC04-5.I4]